MLSLPNIINCDWLKKSTRQSYDDHTTLNHTTWLRIQLSFAILRTVHRCVRGSRYPFKSREVSEDFTFAVAGLHFRPRFLIVFFLVMLDFPLTTLKVFTIVKGFLSWTYI